MVAMKATIYHWNKYVQEFLQEALWSFSLTPRCFSIRFLLRSRARRAPLWMRMQNLLQNGIVIQSYSHSCKTRCDVMFLSIPYYKTKVITILAFWCNCVKKNCKCICDLLTMHTWWESIWWRKNSMSCHNVMYNTDHKSFKTACTNCAVIEARFKYYCFLGLYWKAQYDYLQPHICIMHAVINDNIINNNNLVIC